MAKRRTTDSDESTSKADEAKDQAAPTEEEAAAEEAPKEEAAAKEAASEEEETAKEEEAPAPPTKEEQLAQGKKWLETIFVKMKLQLDVEARMEGDKFVFNLSGADAEDLTGRSRQSPRVLTSIQTLLTEHLGRETRGKVVVDLGGFKEQRQEHLLGVADKLGETTRRLGKALTVAGLNSYERRVIHQHLADDNELDTKSIDNGIFRKLQVYPD